MKQVKQRTICTFDYNNISFWHLEIEVVGIHSALRTRQLSVFILSLQLLVSNRSFGFAKFGVLQSSLSLSKESAQLPCSIFLSNKTLFKWSSAYCQFIATSCCNNDLLLDMHHRQAEFREANFFPVDIFRTSNRLLFSK